MPQTATCPLDDISLPSEGVILKSSDGVEFKVYKNILALASPFFRQMFTLPQPDVSSAEGTGVGTSPDVPVIDVPESSSTLDILLRLIYPVMMSPLPGMSEDGIVADAQALVSGVEPVLAAALKYDMHLIVKQLCEKLLDAADIALPDGNVADDTLALRIFVLACRHGLKEEARRAAHASLKGRVTGVFIEDLRHISAAQYFHLIQFHRKIVAVVDSVVQSTLLFTPYTERLKCSDCGPSQYTNPDFSKWWKHFVVKAGPILRQSPKSTKVFSSTFLASMFDIAANCGSPECQPLPAKWHTISQYIKDSIDEEIAKNAIDLSEV